MQKVKIHGCSRCKTGDVTIDRDYYGWFEECLQCGYVRDFPGVSQQALESGKSESKADLTLNQPGTSLVRKGVR